MKMMRKVVIDTNVLVSALLSSSEDSATVRILAMVFADLVIPVLTDGIFREYGEVLRRRKFNFPEESVSELLEEIKKRSILVNPAVSDLELPDDKDRPFLDALLSEDDAILVTGNLKYFPQHEQIMTARSFIAMHGEL